MPASIEIPMKKGCPGLRGASTLLTLVLILTGAAGARAASTPAEIDAARNKGLAWLLSHQNSDGSWRGTAGSEFAATATTLEVLGNVGLKSAPYARGVAWLGNAKAASVDSLARKIVALQAAGLQVTPHLQALVAWRNGIFAWGAYDHFETSFPDTPLSIGAIRTSGYPSYTNSEFASGLCRIVTAQKGGDATTLGSWSYVTPLSDAPALGISSAILPTVYNILELNAWVTSTLTCSGTDYAPGTVRDSGMDWLLSQRRNTTDGGFGEPVNDQVVSTALGTALVYEVLRTLRPTDPATGPALDYLIAQQNPTDGSWNGDALQTAFVLKVLPPPAAGSAVATLTLFKVGVGAVTSSPGGISCGADCAEQFPNGMTVTLTAAPTAGFAFAGWSGGGCQGTGACAVGLAAATTVTATFVDTTVPTVTITSPTSNPTYITNVSPLTLAGTANDNIGVTEVAWTNNRGGSGTATITTNWTASGIGLQTGANIITVTAKDAANNLATATVTVTYDTTSPADITNFTATNPGTGSQLNLSWTNPTSDFAGTLILRRAGTAVTDTPSSGQTYSAGQTIGSSVVVYANSGTSFNDTDLTNGTTYHYKAFAFDAARNYAGGVAGSGTPSGPTAACPAEVIVDNLSAVQSSAQVSFTGTWSTSTATGAYGAAGSLYSNGSGLDTYTWTRAVFSATQACTYQVYVWWTQHTNRSTTVPITVSGHTGSPTTLTFNERINGGQWNLHGTYTFPAGAQASVTVSDQNGQAAADAVRFVLVAGPITFAQADLVGTWSIYFGETAGDPGQARGNVTIDAVGAVTGSWTDDGGVSRSLAAESTATIDAAGTVSQTYQVSDGRTATLSASMTLSKTVIAGVYTTSGNPLSRGVVTLVKTGSGFTAADLVGTWATYHGETAGAPGYARGMGSVDASGATVGTFVDEENSAQSVGAGSTTTITGAGAVTGTYYWADGRTATLFGSLTTDKDLVTGVYSTTAAPVSLGVGLLVMRPEAQATPTVTVTRTGAGTGTVSSSPSGVACGVTCSATFSSGAAVALTASPNAGSIFVGWSGDCVGLGPCTVTADRARYVMATFSIQPEIVVDNRDANVIRTGSWCVSTAGGFYGTDSEYSCGSGLDTFRWIPTIPTAGSYQVYVRWTAHVNRSTAVPITVTYVGGTNTLTFNQQVNGGVWVLHGTYSFGAGTDGSVEVNDVNGQASADAVRFVPAP